MKVRACVANQRAYIRAVRSAILVSYDADGSRSFTGGKQSGRILMDYTCKHRLLQDHGSPISPIVVYARCVNIMFYRWNPTRESAKGRGVGQTSASSCSFRWYTFPRRVHAPAFRIDMRSWTTFENRETRESCNWEPDVSTWILFLPSSLTFALSLAFLFLAKIVNILLNFDSVWRCTSTRWYKQKEGTSLFFIMAFTRE